MEGGERDSLLERATQEHSRTIRANCWAVMLMSAACTIIFVVVLALSSKVDAERRIFVGTILGVTQLCCALLLIVARNNPHTLSTFMIVCAFVSGLCVGPALWYI